MENLGPTPARRLRAFALAVFAAAASIGVVALVGAAHDWIVEEAAENETLVAQLVANQLVKIDRIVGIVSADAAVRLRETPDLTRSAERAAEAIGERLTVVPYLSGMTILDSDGRTLADTRGAPASGAEDVSDVLAAAMRTGDDGVFGHARRDPVSNRLVLPIARRIDQDGRARAIAIVWADLAGLYESFGADVALGGRATLVIRDDGVALFRLPSIPGFAAGSDMSSHPAFALARAGEAQGAYVGISPIDGVNRVLGFAVVRGGDLIAVTSRVKRTMLLEEFLGRGQIASISGLLLLMALGGTAYASLELRRRRKLLDERDELLRSLELADAGIAISDADTQAFRFVNPAFERMTGYSAAEILGRNYRALQGPATDRATVAALREGLASGQSVRVDIQNYAKNGTPYWSDLSIAPVRRPDGTVRAYVGAFNDITGRVVLNARLRASLDAANAANRAKNSFLARMSHELRTPLNAVIGYADMMLLGIKGTLSDGHRAYAGDIAKSGRHLLAIVEDVLEMARLEQGMRALAAARFDPGLELREAAMLAGADVAAAGAVLELRADGAPAARGDALAFRQIAVNLIANAAKHGRPGGRIVAALESGAGGRVTLTVSDDGPGFPGAVIASLGTPFVGGRPEVAEKGGSGLGLAISVGLARRMGGDLKVENAARGAVVTLDLPAAEASRSAA